MPGVMSERDPSANAPENQDRCSFPNGEIHKSDCGGVEDNVKNDDSVRSKYSRHTAVQYIRNCELGMPRQNIKNPLRRSIIEYCKMFQLYKMESPFDRRVTSMVWHPTNHKLLGIASHGGDILFYNYEQDISKGTFIKGIGPGGSIQDMKFDPLNAEQIYISSMEGKFLLLNFHTKQHNEYLNTDDINRWFVSLDVNAMNNIMVAGDTQGGLTILTLDGKVIDSLQLHKRHTKISHAEFSKRLPWLLCTSSTDGTLKFWDIRNLKPSKGPRRKIIEPLQIIKQDRPINAAYFSLTDGCRLLTTDQMDKIHVYKGPLWNLETTIHHPHRQFQHLTPIRAFWHPLDDIIFAGRYPDKNFPGYMANELRTIDFFDAETGALLHQHSEHGVNGIMSLTRFNNIGDSFSSCYGQRFMVWKPNFKHFEKLSKKQDALDRLPKRRKSSRGNDDDDDDNDGGDDNDGSRGGLNKTDWNAVLKKQTKEKKQKKTTKKKAP